MSQLVFVDDSGDPGFKKHSSRYFVIACVWYTNTYAAETMARTIQSFRGSKGFSEASEFKFRKTKKSVIKEFLELVEKYDFTIDAVYIDKTEFHGIFTLTDQSKLYRWTIQQLLQGLNLENARIRIDGRSNKAYMRDTSTYLRRELNATTRKIKDIRFEDSQRNDLIQLADIIAGAINRSLQKSKPDHLDYLAIVARKVATIRKITK